MKGGVYSFFFSRFFFRVAGSAREGCCRAGSFVVANVDVKNRRAKEQSDPWWWRGEKRVGVCTDSRPG